MKILVDLENKSLPYSFKASAVTSQYASYKLFSNRRRPTSTA